MDDDFGIALLMVALAGVFGFLVAIYLGGFALCGVPPLPWYVPHVPLLILGVLSAILASGGRGMWWVVALAISLPMFMLPGLLIETVLFAFGGALLAYFVARKGGR